MVSKSKEIELTAINSLNGRDGLQTNITYSIITLTYNLPLLYPTILFMIEKERFTEDMFMNACIRCFFYFPELKCNLRVLGPDMEYTCSTGSRLIEEYMTDKLVRKQIM